MIRRSYRVRVDRREPSDGNAVPVHEKFVEIPRDFPENSDNKIFYRGRFSRGRWPFWVFGVVDLLRVQPRAGKRTLEIRVQRVFGGAIHVDHRKHFEFGMESFQQFSGCVAAKIL